METNLYRITGISKGQHHLFKIKDTLQSALHSLGYNKAKVRTEGQTNLLVEGPFAQDVLTKTIPNLRSNNPNLEGLLTTFRIEPYDPSSKKLSTQGDDARKLKDENEQLWDENQRLEGRVNELEKQLGEQKQLEEEFYKPEIAGKDKVIREKDQTITRLERKLKDFESLLDTERKKSKVLDVEGLIGKYIEGQSGHYRQVAMFCDSFEEDFDPTFDRAGFIFQRLQDFGKVKTREEYDAAIKRSDTPWEESEYFRLNREKADKAAKDIKLIGDFNGGKINLDSVETNVKELLVKTLKEAVEKIDVAECQKTTREFEEEREKYKMPHALKADIEKFGEQYDGQMALREQLEREFPRQSRNLNYFLVLRSEIESFSLTVYLPVPQDMRKSYLHNCLVQIIGANSAVISRKRLKIEEGGTDGAIAYRFNFPKSAWDAQSLAAFRYELMNEISSRSREFPIFNMGFFLKPTYIEVEGLTAVEIDEQRIEQRNGKNGEASTKNGEDLLETIVSVLDKSGPLTKGKIKDQVWEKYPEGQKPHKARIGKMIDQGVNEGRITTNPGPQQQNPLYLLNRLQQ